MKVKHEPSSQASCSSSPTSSPPIFLLTLPEYEIQIRPRQPTCHTCKEVAIRLVTSSLNSINAGRPYYICPSCPRECRWVCWADTKGIAGGNPPCDCEQPSRLDIIGKSNKGKAGRGFWTCVTGKCEYYSENDDGTPGVSFDGGFYP